LTATGTSEVVPVPPAPLPSPDRARQGDSEHDGPECDRGQELTLHRIRARSPSSTATRRRDGADAGRKRGAKVVEATWSGAKLQHESKRPSRVSKARDTDRNRLARGDRRAGP
jgi:hypothetical protein